MVISSPWAVVDVAPLSSTCRGNWKKYWALFASSVVLWSSNHETSRLPPLMQILTPASIRVVIFGHHVSGHAKADQVKRESSDTIHKCAISGC